MKKLLLSLFVFSGLLHAAPAPLAIQPGIMYNNVNLIYANGLSNPNYIYDNYVMDWGSPAYDGGCTTTADCQSGQSLICVSVASLNAAFVQAILQLRCKLWPQNCNGSTADIYPNLGKAGLCVNMLFPNAVIL